MLENQKETVMDAPLAGSIAKGAPRALPWGIPRTGTYTVALVATLLSIAMLAIGRPLDTDLWWHLKDGAYILSHHGIPTRDFLSFTFRGHPWTDHEWLSEVLMWSAYRLAGFWLLALLFAGVIVSTTTLTYARMRQLGSNQAAAILTLLVCAGASVAYWGERPQILTLLFLAAYSWLYGHVRNGGRERWMLAFPVLMVPWVNLHGGFVLGLAFLAIILVGELANRFMRLDGHMTPRRLRLLAAAFVATMLATLINPLGLGELLYPLVWLRPTEYTNWLTEWASTNFHSPLMMLFEIMILTLMAAYFIARPKLDWPTILLSLAFTHLALEQTRNVAVWCVLVAPFVAAYGTQAGRVLARHSDAAPKPAHRNAVNTVLLAVLLLTYVIAGAQYFKPAMFRTYEKTEFPAAAMTFLDNHHQPRRVFVSYGWGGYLLWRGSPHYQDFIDGRANTLFSDRLLSNYIQINNGGPAWSRLLYRYRVGTVLVDPQSAIAQLLATSPDWKRVFSGTLAVVYVRANPGADS
jgi:hypothetical protein